VAKFDEGPLCQRAFRFLGTAIIASRAFPAAAQFLTPNRDASAWRARHRFSFNQMSQLFEQWVALQRGLSHLLYLTCDRNILRTERQPTEVCFQNTKPGKPARKKEIVFYQGRCPARVA
jgi:hypothetical protein